MESFGSRKVLKVAIVCSYYPWPPSFGGVETMVRNVSTELAKRGHELHVITTPFDVTMMRQVSDYGVEERDGVTVHKLEPRKLRVGYARLLKGFKDAIHEIRPEIVHSHNLHPHLFQLAKWKDKLKYKLVAELHHPAVELDFFIQKLSMPLTTIMLMNFSKVIDTFIAHTTLEKEWLSNKGIYEGKVLIVRFPAIPSTLISYRVDSKSLDEIIYLGRIVCRKGLHVLIRALYKVKKTFGEIRATIAGPSDPQYLSRLMKLAKQLGLESNVVIRGLVPEEEKYKIIKSHKILVLPSLKEYTPSVLLEAQALGVPVIATKVGAVSEIMVDGETGLLVEPANEHELAKAIEILIKDDELRRQFSIKAMEFAKNFTLEEAVNRLGDLYCGLINRKINSSEIRP